MLRNTDIRRLNRLVLELSDQLLEERPGVFVGDLFNWSVKPHDVCEARSALIERVRGCVQWRHENGTPYQQVRINGYTIEETERGEMMVPDNSDDRWRPASTVMIAKMLGAKVHSTILLIERRSRRSPSSPTGAPKAPDVPGGGEIGVTHDL